MTPAPPVGSIITYTLYIGTTQIATNTTGVFTTLLPNTTYTILATINFACSGVQTTANFILPAPTIVATPTHTTCGNNTGQINIAASGTLAPYTYSLDGITYGVINPFINLAAGIYTVFVKDANGCINKTNVTILNSDGPTFIFTQINATCGSNAGTVTITTSGGTLPYQYSINNGATYQANNFFTGLLPNTYVIKVKDALGCINSANVTILSGPTPLLNAIPASATCGNNNGTINAFGSGGTNPLQYSINGNIFQASGLFTGLTPGAYTVTVKDAIGCFVSVSVTVANNPPPTVTGTTTPAACGNINGSITATGSNGVAPLTYSINGTIFQSTGLFTGLAAGTYTVTVKDFFGCIATTNVLISSTGGPTATAVSTAANCATNNGSITITGIGVGPFTYSINGTTFVATNLFTNLAAGNYIAFVRNAGGCIGAVNIIVNAVAGPTITAVSTAASCIANNGTITATGSGVSTPLEYSIDGITYSSTFTFTNLAPNTYSVYVKDALGCIKTTIVVVGNASGLGLTLSAVNSSCNNNGVITAVATGGVLPLQYNINGGAYQPSNIFNNLAPSTYTVTVKDFNNCIVTKIVSVISVTGLSLIANVPMQASCASANAVIIANGSGGIAPLTYSINGVTFFSSGTFLNVGSGNYTVIVKDATGCIATQLVTINPSSGGPAITTFTVRIRNAYACNDNVGRIDQFRVNGANCATCTYSINYGAYLTALDPIWAIMVPGTYAITAKDANGCTKTIIATIGLAVLSTATYTVTGTACNTSNGSITLTGVGPNTPYHASITGIGGPFVDFNPTHTFTNLGAGTYTIIIADDEDFNASNDPSNCLVYLTVVVPSIGGPTISTTQTAIVCNSNNGSITVTAGAGTAPYSYNINSGAFQNNPIFNNLAPGTYIMGVRDATGCINRTTVVLTAPSLPSVTGFSLPTSCGINNGSITLTAGSGGTAPYEFSINGTIFEVSNIFTNLAAGSYTVYIKDATGCFTSTIITVSTAAIPKVTAFTIAASCNNNDGSIFATGTLGTTPYQFSLDGIVYQSSNIFNGLAAGFYTVYMKDDRGCVVTTGVTIGNLSAAIFTTVVVAAKCGNQNGSIAINVTGGTAPYQYSSDGGLTYQSVTNILTPLFAGTYTVIVKDANSCLTTQAILVPNTVGPQTLTATVVHAACANANGTITAAATGGTGALQYSKDGITFQPTGLFTLLAANNYTITVRDANLCIKTLAVTVLDLPAPTLSATSSPATCGLSDGTITAVATGGTLPLTYSKNGVVFQSSNIFTGLAAAPYTITVADARNCRTTFNITVGTLGIAVTPTFTPVAPICTGANLNALPTLSTNTPAITGNWAPALDNTTTTVYTFTPATGQCATTTTLTITVNANTTPTFDAVAAICSGAPLSPLPTTSLNGITGNWSPALDNTTTTVYTFTPTAGQCATTTTLTITVTGGTSGIWTGVIDTDWFKAGNWTCGGVPTSTTNVLVPTGLTNYPLIPSGNALSHNINIQAGASVTVTVIGMYSLYGTITNTGVFNFLDGTLNLTGLVAQVFAGTSILNHTIKNIVLSNIASLSDSLSVTGNVSFGASNITFTTNDFLTLVSNALRTASYNDITNAGTTTGNITTSNVTIERYLFGQKSWRLLAAPVEIATSPSIANSWREGNNALAATGFGTQITGPTGPVLATFGGELDYYTQRGSMKYYDTATNTYIEIANTINTKIANKEGYMVFVRGDRAAPNTTTGLGTATTLRIKGKIRTGDHFFRVPTNGFLSVGNPYPSAIDFRLVDTVAIANSFYAWNPTLYGAFGVGGYEPYVFDGTHYVKIPGGNIRDSIQSGEAFFIQSITGGSITIKETSKAKDSRLVSRVNAQARTGVTTPTLEINLFLKDGNGNNSLVDGVKIDFNNGYSNLIDNDDVKKISNTADNLAIRKGNRLLVVERHATLQALDTFFLNITNTRIAQYYFEIDLSVLTNIGLEAFLKDKFLQTETAISFSNVTTVLFNITADAGSRVANRFMIVFKQPSTNFTTISATRNVDNTVIIHWGIQNERNVSSYSVEQSNDGINFTTINTQAAIANDGSNLTYSKTDATASKSNNWYRVKANNVNGIVKYTAIAMVGAVLDEAIVKPSIIIFPNPVTNKKLINIKFTNKVGNYILQLIGNDGKIIHTENIVVTNMEETKKINLNKHISQGQYELVLLDSNNKKEVTTIVVH